MLLVGLVAPTAADATDLVTDPAHQFKPRQLARMQRWLDRSHVPTPTRVTVHAGECPASVACANVDHDAEGWYERPGHVRRARRRPLQLPPLARAR